MAFSGDDKFQKLLNSRAMQRQRDQLAKLKSERKKIESTKTPVLRERPEHLSRPTHVFTRGLFLTKGEQVTGGVPASLVSHEGSPVSDRLALANWIVSEENPLTARVAVNRFWARLFGVGLVETEEDFGSSGEPPSHPKLLDHLASKFQGEYQWSIKKLLRDMVLSRVPTDKLPRPRLSCSSAIPTTACSGTWTLPIGFPPRSFEIRRLPFPVC